MTDECTLADILAAREMLEGVGHLFWVEQPERRSPRSTRCKSS